jgi:hypothetical protein
MGVVFCFFFLFSSSIFEAWSLFSHGDKSIHWMQTNPKSLMSCLIKTNYTSLAMPIKFKNYFYKKLFFNIFFFKIKHLKKQLFSQMKSGNTITFDDCIIEEYGAARILQIKKTPARRRHYKCTSSLVCNPL